MGGAAAGGAWSEDGLGLGLPLPPSFSNNIRDSLSKRCTIVQQQGMITVTVSEEKL
jgi:hypothetical protein